MGNSGTGRHADGFDFYWKPLERARLRPPPTTLVTERGALRAREAVPVGRGFRALKDAVGDGLASPGTVHLARRHRLDEAEVALLAADGASESVVRLRARHVGSLLARVRGRKASDRLLERSEILHHVAALTEPELRLVGARPKRVPRGPTSSTP